MKANHSRNIYDYLFDLIVENKYNPDFRLPSENELAERFGASRTAARLAFERLEAKGLVLRKRGSGSFVNTDHLKSREESDPRLTYSVAALLPYPQPVFITDILMGISDFFRTNDILCHFFFTYERPDMETDMLKILAKKQFDGLLFYPQSKDPLCPEIRELIESGYPVVSIDRYYKGLNLYAVSTNHFGDCYKAIQKLVELGRQNICFITEARGITSIEHRINGFRTAVRHFLPAGTDPSLLVLPRINAGFEQGFEPILERHLRDHPDTDAIITTSGFFSLHTIEVLKRMHKVIGRDLDLVFFDNEIINFDSTLYPYIQIRQNSAGIGEKAGEILVKLMRKLPLQEKMDVRIPSSMELINFDLRSGL